MATVKYAVSAYTADGVTTDYLITWDYLDEDHIAVYVDGTSNADPQANHTFTKLNNTTLRITDGVGGAIASGAEIEIRRETPILTRAITFADGSALLAEDLNKNSDYLLYSMQEVLDTVDAAAQDGALAAEVATTALRDEAEVHKDDAEAAKTAAEAARDTSQTYLATVQSDATDADNHRIAAEASELASAASEAAAAVSEANSASSADASATSAAASLASEQASAASETAAAASELAAATSETNAAASETAAQAAQAAAEAALDGFTDQYLGAKATAPTVDNDGDPLQIGALYWNNVSDAMYVWNGTAWDTLPTTIGIADGATSTKVTITDTDTTFANKVILDNGVVVSGYPTAPASPVVGELWYDTTTNTLFNWSGNRWVSLNSIPVVTGGTVNEYVEAGITYVSHTFTSSSTLKIENAQLSNAEILLVAGGGGGATASGGAGAAGGGGGAGGVILETGLTIPIGTYNVVVGAGGAGSTNNTTGSGTGGNGSNSTFLSRTAVKGGGGGSRDTDGQDGGSGGGTNHADEGGREGYGTAGQGNDGGRGGNIPSPSCGGGGGGYSSQGEDINFNSDDRGGDGGLGLANTFQDGTSRFYAGGGGGGGGFNRGGYGGNNVGADGAAGTGSTSRSVSAPNNAVVNRGGGGGGSSGAGNGSNGSSGIFIIRYIK